MNTLVKRLPLFAFVLAAFTAMAFSFPKANDPMFGQSGSTWYDVTNTLPSDDTYRCESGSEHCLYDDHSGSGEPISPAGEEFVVKDASNLIEVL